MLKKVDTNWVILATPKLDKKRYEASENKSSERPSYEQWVLRLAELVEHLDDVFAVSVVYALTTEPILFISLASTAAERIGYLETELSQILELNNIPMSLVPSRRNKV